MGIRIIPKNKAMSLCSKIINTNSICYYLTDDYAHFTDLRDKFADKTKIRNLSGLFDETFQEIKGPALELISKLNKKHDSFEWWGGQLASKSTSATSLYLNITYLFCVKKILSDTDSDKDVIFIVNSPALSDCISNMAKKYGCQVVIYRNRVDECLESIKFWLLYCVKVIYFFCQAIRNRWAAFKLLKPLQPPKTDLKKRIVIRSWITKGNFDKAGKFKDRNFGDLPEWLRSKEYEIWTLPMLFNLSMTTKEVYSLMRDQEESFLIPDHYLKFSDYLKGFYNNYQMLKLRVENIEMGKIDISPIINEALRKQSFPPASVILDLCCPMLTRLKKARFEIDAFYYPFEGNTPEKKFILYCKKHFPDSKIIGFQHVSFYPNQLTYYLGPNEKDCHPLPDKIICSGPIYIESLKNAGFPYEILAAGPNLRFGSVYMNKPKSKDMVDIKEKMIMVPLTFSRDLAFESFVKLRDALKDIRGYKLLIRNHPLLPKMAVQDFLNNIGMIDYDFADDGVIQDWLPGLYAIISAGASVTVLEAAVAGTPVIRVVPDNTFFYDPFIWPDYPFEPVNTSSEIRQQIQFIDEILDNDKTAFMKIGKQVLTKYFTKPTEENLKVFDLNY